MRRIYGMASSLRRVGHSTRSQQQYGRRGKALAIAQATLPHFYGRLAANCHRYPFLECYSKVGANRRSKRSNIIADLWHDLRY
jgi:hypothetical protein